MHNSDLFKLDKAVEEHQFVPIVINYRNLMNANNFCVKYTIYHKCTGSWKFSNSKTQELLSKSFIDIPIDCYLDTTINKCTRTFLKHIYKNIYTEKECSDSVKIYWRIYNII